MPTQTTQPARSPAADNPFEQFQWKPQPEAERLVRELVDGFLKHSPFAAMLRDRMYAEAGVRFHDLVDHIVLGDDAEIRSRLDRAGFRARGAYDSPDEDEPYFANEQGIFPTILPYKLFHADDLRVYLRVESIADFVSVWQTPCELFGNRSLNPWARMRLAQVDQAGRATLWVVERHGYRKHDATWGNVGRNAEAVLAHAEHFKMRPRRLAEEDGFAAVEQLIEAASAALDRDYVCDLFFAAERDYWQRRNWAGAIQKARQDRLGIGWANHDHHTYRSSRKHFARLISVFEKLGFHCRERFYAGRQAGWGAQVLEQPNAGIVIFADVDLSPDELLIDFAHEPLPERQQLGTVGLWCALHGESFLEAGMHHLECQFDFEALRTQLESEAGIRTMKPFTDFPYLRQAFTEGERWPVREERIQKLLERGQITAEQAEGFRTQGAIGSHLENLERNEGFKGFNQTGVSEIIAATDPRKHVRG